MSKDKKKSLNTIADSFRAAYKIQTIKNSSLVRSDGTSSVRKAEPDTLKEMLQVLTQYSPESYRGNISKSLEESSLYADTYKNLKQHLKSTSSRSVKSEDLIDVMQIVKPALKGKNLHVIEKVLRIYEIMRS